MRAALLAPLFLLGMEAAALACSCVPAEPPEQSREIARKVLTGAVAIVEADILAGYDRGLKRGEQVQVTKTLWGKAPRGFEVYRPGSPNSARCDIELTPGKRRFLILYPAPKSVAGRPRFQVQNLCSDYLVSDARYRAVALQALRKR
jgi:hypothetical protein